MTTGGPDVAKPDVAGHRVTAVVVNYRTPDLAMDCLAALDRERRLLLGLDVILVDGGSGDGSADKLKTGIAERDLASWVTLLPLDFNGGFGWANNQAIRMALSRTDPAEFIFLVNPDAVIEEGALAALVAALLASPDAASAGSLLLAPGGHALGSAFRFPDIGNEFIRGANTPAIERLIGGRPLVIESDREVAADWVTGASVLLRAEALRACGLFDEGFFLYYEEVELMHRLKKAGWRSLHVPDSRVFHVGGAATGVVDGSSAQRPLPDYWFESRRRFFARAYGPGHARLAGLAWLAGFGIWRLREILGLGRDSAHAPGEWRDLIRNGIKASSFDREAAIGRWDEPPGKLPRWKTRS